MFIEKIDQQLVEEIRDAMDEEYEQIVANWEGEFIDFYEGDFEGVLKSDIFGEYLSIPLDTVVPMIHEQFAFIQDKEIGILPFSEAIFVENGSQTEVSLHAYAGILNIDRQLLTQFELKQIDVLLKELTQLYDNLGLNTTLYITDVPTEDVPEDYYTDDNEDDDDDPIEHDFVQISF